MIPLDAPFVSTRELVLDEAPAGRRRWRGERLRDAVAAILYGACLLVLVAHLVGDAS